MTEQVPPSIKNLAYIYNLDSDFWPNFLLEMVKLEKVRVCVWGGEESCLGNKPHEYRQ